MNADLKTKIDAAMGGRAFCWDNDGLNVLGGEFTLRQLDALAEVVGTRNITIDVSGGFDGDIDVEITWSQEKPRPT